MDINKPYKNGQKMAEQIDDIRIVYFISGKLKAKGPYINNKLQGLWIFNRKLGKLWQEGHFADDVKNGEWKRYSKSGKLEYHVIFINGKPVRKII